ncbi:MULTISPECIES: hypothetical protein [Streptomyces]|uniref:Uncharacterized protein n=1 Tax=Streptomyces ehimensis TaxID=68195 RepID=A0ABV9BQQ7_9ACTN
MTDSRDRAISLKFRTSPAWWDAHSRVAGRQGADRVADLLDHVRSVINERGDRQDLDALAASEQEVAERRARKGGLPLRRGS